ncbi:MAG TPA: LLM class F420-dependent oxidoreductase [Kofleriaceae bacterium]|jgi:F420-dependent oxidoreductase-like protein|nr:LLM class F420-dependent oxidoreductase [Kofleriaceae bacterium]
MRLGLMVGYSGAAMDVDIATIREAERLGYHSCWTAEAWGSDAVSPLAWIGAQTSRITLGTAIMQLPGRSPANTAMTAMTLDALSGQRFILGLGTSGPQVVEGWHGQPWHEPLTWLREYITIVKKIFAREAPLVFEGKRYQIPYRGPGSAGLGKPLKSILHGRKEIPIYSGSMAPRGQELAGELCDGLLLTCMNPHRPEVIVDRVKAGIERAGGGKRLEDFDIAPTVAVVLGDDVDACRRPLKEQLALYIGGMGAKDKNFYREYLTRVGFEEPCARIAERFLAGQRREAVAAVPDELVDTLYLVGPADRIRERFQAWKGSGVTTMIVGARQIEAIRLLAELAS